ncbi:uncharacterized protein B0I36DRAFT_329799 [Microdochium trichocladiopsis]|uniref:Uncharacterized protein n=1 Tax=Microdochium trichocladiopsis TaxID=1682393 RepID=A0A9P8Y048_9PEZI|nr:uncharacterized protein B0I36DRAFT_329799 [Microdochium trichocladiopsis]KAH7026061.1 hypothetical protein B0I36DRAFT_329799 [Microdochium trichocladiopsis]
MAFTSTKKHASLASLALLTAAASASALVSPRQASSSQEDYINSVCRPPLAEDADTSSAFVVPPCIAVETIEGLCQPNGTSPLALEAHAQCMCGSTFFSQWRGCQACQVFHGARSEREVAHFEAALVIASSELCGAAATPTAPFPVLFSSADFVAPYPSTGATTSRDAKPSDPAVSLYFTPSGSSWGAGAITGSATAATATGGGLTLTLTASDSDSDSSSSAGTTASRSTTGGSSPSSNQQSTISTTSAPGMAAPTAGAGVKGLLLAVAGGAMVAAL